MNRTQFEALREVFNAAEGEMLREIDALAYPADRQAAYERVNALCEVSPAAMGFGPISREPNTWWKTRRY